MGAMRLMFGYDQSVLPVPTPFIDRFMTGCPPLYPLIYLYSWRRAEAGEVISSSELAAFFNILETDVNNAWQHWKDMGVVSLDGDAEDMTIVFLHVSEWGEGTNAAVVKGMHNEPTPAKIPTPAKARAKTPDKSPAQSVPIGERPHYEVDELTLFRANSKEVACLFTAAEQALGKPLTYHDMNVLFGFYDWLRLPVDVLIYLLEYCAEKDHRDLRYIEKCALDWADKGIATVDDAKRYAQSFDGDYRAVLKAMGANATFPTPTQRKYIDKWRGEWAMTVKMILEACDRAAVQIGKPKFTYVDKIIASWFKAGITTLEGIKTADEAFIHNRDNHSQTSAAAIKPATKAKPSRFANFTQRNNDYSRLEQLQREHMIREAKE
ncbi:MAG: DnaD domain protein [Defluviitaleaceae bacterium]|nr:DnaD domain protein [Defluviitaleaceae bacterium]